MMGLVAIHLFSRGVAQDCKVIVGLRLSGLKIQEMLELGYLHRLFKVSVISTLWVMLCKTYINIADGKILET